MNIQNSTQERWADWGMRIVLAIVFITAAYGKFFDFGVNSFSQLVNIPIWLGWVGAIGELAAGIGIIVGKLLDEKTGRWVTKISGLLIMVIMVFAFVLVKYKGFEKGFLAGLQEIDDIMALFAMGLYYFLKF